MLTTMVIDDDVLAYARAIAQRESVALGAAMSRLVRAGIEAQQQPVPVPPLVLKSRLLPLRGRVHATAMGATPEFREIA